MDFLKPENLLRFGYKDCVLCDVERKGEGKRCERCSGRLDQRERLLWEIRRERIRRTAGRLSLIFPGLGHFYAGRYAGGAFWFSLLPLTLGPVLYVWKGATVGHAFLLVSAAMTWWLAWMDARRGPREQVAPCESACPAGIRVPDYIALVRENRPLEALALVLDKLPFAAFCGRACPHPCEQECVRNEFGAPISIMAIKRYAADLGYAAGFRPHPEAAEEGKSPRVAVVGAGPAGLSAADTLARLGCRVTVYDSNEEPGGMMRYGAAEFRFPAEALRSDMDHVFARGVRFRGGAAIGRDVPFTALEQEGFEAVLIAAGTPVSLTLPGSGTVAQGFHDARSFLESVRRKKPVRISGRVVVIGGGDVAIDSARTALRLGASDATVACIEPLDRMPAHPWEVEDAVAEGVKILPSVAVNGFSMRGGRVAGVEALRVERFDRDAEGRVVPRTIDGTGFDIPADTVVMAVGSRAEEGFLPPEASRAPLDRRNHVYRLFFRGSDSKMLFYSCGDCVSGPRTVVEASASGRAAALNIFSKLRVESGNNSRYRDNYRRIREPHEPDRPEWRIRRKGERLSVEERRGNFGEIEKGLTARCAREESERCARCNLMLQTRRKGGEKG
jgi:NADPH-dependent glutamate synthase beta subunit-like oxidoreductase